MPKGRTDTKKQVTDTSKEKTLKKKIPDSHSDIASPAPANLQQSTHDKPIFTATDFSHLCENEHGRYARNSKKIGHAVIFEGTAETTAAQYELPTPKEAPTVRPLINIEAIEPFPGMHRYRAETPDSHTPMYAKRFITGKVGEESSQQSFQIACFSPSPQEGKEPFWGSIRKIPLFRENLSPFEKKELEKELKEIGKVTKGGEALIIEHASVPKREKMPRTPSQNDIMGESARDAYQHFYEKFEDVLHPDMKEILKRAFNAKLEESLYKNNHRPEWLHRDGWSLMPVGMNPQTKKNLGAAPRWTNTQMMILERIAKWFAINVPESILEIQSIFEMLLDSELIEHIDFKTRTQIKTRFVEFTQSIDPLLQHPTFPKASDLAQAAGIADSMLHQVQPSSTQKVKAAKKSSVQKTPKEDKQVSSKSAFLSSHESEVSSQSSRKRKREEVTVADDDVIEPPKKRSAASLPITKDDKSPTHSHRKRKHDEMTDVDNPPSPQATRAKFPTQNPYERSVVQIYVDNFTPDYDYPWRDPETSSCKGSGFVVEHEGKKYILTNAHVAENATFMQIRLANDRRKKYPAKAKCVAYQCDLALLEVDDPEFQEIVKPVEFGHMVNSQQKVTVVGSPMGGTEVSLSKGIVSRIQTGNYVMSNQDLLSAQTDAAVNPGNSGGPVFSDGKVVGVAFQGWHAHQGLNYFIPMPIVSHFLKEALSNQPYRGFPTMPIFTEVLENPSERKFYGMQDKTGIRIVKINKLSDAYGKLKPDDILLAIDGLPISNEKTVDIPGIGDCIHYTHMTQSKFIGDTVKLKILRKNPETQRAEELEIDVKLDTILGDTEIVSIPEHDRMPTFYFNSGICFVPLTRNYIDGDGCEFDEVWLEEEGCALPDAPKKEAGDEVIVIHTIINSTETQGYDKHLRGVVKEINGNPIHNMHDVIRAMEGYTGETHVISLKTKSNDKIIIPNMPAKAFLELLKQNHISRTHSEDLDSFVNAACVDVSSETSAKTSETTAQKAPCIIAPTPQKPSQEKSRRHIVIETSSDEEVAKKTISPMQDIEALDTILTRDMLPGIRHYREAVEDIEERYKNIPEFDEEDDAPYVNTSEEEYSSDEEQYSEAEEAETDEEEVKAEETLPSSPAIHGSQVSLLRRHSIFRSSRREEDSSSIEKKRARAFK